MAPGGTFVATGAMDGDNFAAASNFLHAGDVAVLRRTSKDIKRATDVAVQARAVLRIAELKAMLQEASALINLSSASHELHDFRSGAWAPFRALLPLWEATPAAPQGAAQDDDAVQIVGAGGEHHGWRLQDGERPHPEGA